jgi:hypothetical protein
MSNPINWGATPLANGAVRGFLAAIVTGILYAIYEWQKGVPLEQAVGAGAVPMLLMFLSLLGYGVADQSRANTGTVIASDVPVQLEAKEFSHQQVQMADIPGDIIRAPKKNAADIARELTAHYRSRPYVR